MKSLCKLAGITSPCPGKRISYRQSRHDVGGGRKCCFLEESAIGTPVVTKLELHINRSVLNVQGKWINAANTERGRSHNLGKDKQKERMN
jgi:hypothetical protein